MTAETAAVVEVSPLAALTDAARAAGPAVIAASAWPESEADEAAPALAGFIVSSFSPIAAEVAQRCLRRRAGARDAYTGAESLREETAYEPATAVIMVSALGDVASAVRVAA